MSIRVTEYEALAFVPTHPRDNTFRPIAVVEQVCSRTGATFARLSHDCAELTGWTLEDIVDEGGEWRHSVLDIRISKIRTLLNSALDRRVVSG